MISGYNFGRKTEREVGNQKQIQIHFNKGIPKVLSYFLQYMKIVKILHNFNHISWSIFVLRGTHVFFTLQFWYSEGCLHYSNKDTLNFSAVPEQTTRIHSVKRRNCVLPAKEMPRGCPPAGREYWTLKRDLF